MPGLYSSWGFKASPFDTTSLGANATGRRLHVGRKKQLEDFTRRLHTPPKLPTVEGANGIGKTSLVNVACYEAYVSHLESGEGPLHILCDESFQLSSNTDPDLFIQNVYIAIAQTLIAKARELEGPRFEQLRRRSAPLHSWLNKPDQLSGIQATVAVLSGGFTRERNTTAGFEQSGLRRQVQGLLDEMFPTPDSGAIVCVIDNLELLQTSRDARRMLEILRDPLFQANGLRWVLCGAQGIVYGVAESPRLDGLLHPPVQVGDLGVSHAVELLESRMEVFAAGPDATLPIRAGDFRKLFEILGGNLRSVLSRADQYCQWVGDRHAPNKVQGLGDEEKEALFGRWLDTTSLEYLRSVRENLRPRAWSVFERAIELGRSFSPSEFTEFGLESPQALRPHVKELEDAGLLQSVTDESDHRRRTITVQPKGWFVEYARRKQEADEET